MGLTKRNYTDGVTVITAQNLNDIQDNVRSNLSSVSFNSSNGKLQKTTNSGTTTDILTVDTTPTDNSMNPISSDAAKDLKDAISDVESKLPTFVENNPNSTSCPSNTVTTLANLSLQNGSWILIASHEWTENVNAQYNDYFMNITDNNTIASTRNISMVSGGGATMAAFLTIEASKVVRFATYNMDSQTRTAKTIKFAAIKIA